MASVANLIIAAAQSAGIDPSIPLEVATQESGLNANVRDGAAGEIGVFQIEPATAPGVNLRDLQTNISTGVGLLASYLGLFGGNVQAAVAAYNCGQQCVLNAMTTAGSNWFSAIPSSTQGYVNSVLAGVSSYSATINLPSLSPLTAGFASPVGAGGSSLAATGVPWTTIAIVAAAILVLGIIVSE